MADIRILKYNQLVTSGFTSQHASRFRDFKQELVDELCNMMEQAKKSKDEIDRKVMARISDLLMRNGKRL